MQVRLRRLREHESRCPNHRSVITGHASGLCKDCRTRKCARKECNRVFIWERVGESNLYCAGCRTNRAKQISGINSGIAQYACG